MEESCVFKAFSSDLPVSSPTVNKSFLKKKNLKLSVYENGMRGGQETCPLGNFPPFIINILDNRYTIRVKTLLIDGS